MERFLRSSRHKCCLNCGGITMCYIDIHDAAQIAVLIFFLAKNRFRNFFAF